MVKRLVFAVPGDLATPTGGYAFDRRIIAELEKLQWTIEVIDLGSDFPWPAKATREHAAARLAMTPEGSTVMIDGLALGTLPEAARRLRPNHTLVALVHHPLAMETGINASQADILRASERSALAAARHVIVTGKTTADQLIAEYNVPADKITIVLPGTDTTGFSAGSRDGIVRILSVGAIVPRKGFDVLITALGAIRELPWRIVIAGDRTRHPETAARLDDQIARLELGERVILEGAVASSRLQQLYLDSDLFALASRYEGYGMAYGEAVAHGLPVIGTRVGAAADLVPPGAGILVSPEDPVSFAQALRRLIENPNERSRAAAAARAAAEKLPKWEEAARILAVALESLR
ncbi:MAG TPA: glycosyltransferase family 4 protein [Pseudolabrys sp.]|nr:glycosyltransferase family 4 protein [Pseudolabrys sp.]